VTIANQEQARHWNSDEASHWVTHQADHDRMLAPFTDMLLGAAVLSPGDRVADVGCGCGATTRAAAQAVAPGPVLGFDLSAAMLARARADARAAGLANAAFEQADAQIYPFGDASFDAVISRFGIMFFDDPVAAFANLRRATRPGGRLAFVCWQDFTANQWLLVPGAALAQHVTLPDLAPPGAAGMLALADPSRVRAVLSGAGWRDIAIAPRHTSMLVGGGGTLEDGPHRARRGQRRHRRPGPSRGARRPCSAPHRRRRASRRGGVVRVRHPGYVSWFSGKDLAMLLSRPRCARLACGLSAMGD
jgi:SAM-dependent methyltransferase